MKLARIFLATIAFWSASPASAELDLKRADVSHLPNGLTAIMLEDHSFPLVSVQMLYKSGSAAEVTGKTGLAHFLEHLAFRASENFPNAGATEAIYDSGGEWHGYTAMDQTTYFATMPKDGLELLLRIEADRMARTTIDPAAIDAEKGAVITELHSYENDPASVLLETVTRTALQAHPYGSPMAGYVSDVERLTIDDARAYYASHYAPGNAVLAIVGDFATSQAKTLIASSFANVPARPVATLNPTVEPPQRGERRTRMLGPVDRQYFQIAFPAPAASDADFIPFLVLQEILGGGSGVNQHQTSWAATRAKEWSLLFGATEDITSWLPPTRDAFLFTIGGSVEAKAGTAAIEHEIDRRIAGLRDQRVPDSTLAKAKSRVISAIAEDVVTTEEAAHQLALFEGLGALDVLLSLPEHLRSVRSEDVQRVARKYLIPERRTIGWMVPGRPPLVPDAARSPRAASDRAGSPTPSPAAGEPQLRRLRGGLPAIVQTNPLSDTVTVQLLLSAPVDGGSHPEDLPGLDAIVRSGPSEDLAALVGQTMAAARKGQASAEARSEDPTTRLEQLIAAEIVSKGTRAPKPLGVFVSGNVQPAEAFEIVEQHFGAISPGNIGHLVPGGESQAKVVRERIAKPLAQGALGYVVEGPAPGTREAQVWRMLLYVLTHHYSGRLGRTAIAEKGIVYYIGSAVRTDGRRSWATISIGVDPDKADAMEAELRAQLARLMTEPPSATETDAARSHLLGRDVTAAQSNEELTAKLARQFVETGGLRSRDELRSTLQSITPAHLTAAVKGFVDGTIIRVDVAR